ncbi:MAG: diaminopimelate epimerase [Bacteroidetes bacterium]|nr:MAG: diaminopimelate epimerase [Bacteroidota bacterium]
MRLRFYKYQGTGNDFILIDNRNELLPRSNPELYGAWCDRRFGIGADGLILLQNKEGYDFEMVYFNSDGRESTMCGNGGRCIVQFAHDRGLIEDETRFLAVDGPHDARIEKGIVSLHMQDVQGVESIGADFYLNTGSPHYVQFTNSDVGSIDLTTVAKSIRYNDRFAKEGTNVNLVEAKDHCLEVRTYERGVEDETYSCGTGVTAVALVNHICSENGSYRQAIHTPGGDLAVSLTKTGEGSFSDVWLHGPATFVFEGELVYP